MKENTAAIHVQVPVDVATYLLNEKRNEIHVVEQRLVLVEELLFAPDHEVEFALARLRDAGGHAAFERAGADLVGALFNLGVRGRGDRGCEDRAGCSAVA